MNASAVACPAVRRYPVDLPAQDAGFFIRTLP